MPSPESTQETELNYVYLNSETIHLNCGDGREPTDEEVVAYAKVFGGRPALAWNALALQEMTSPGSVQETLVDADARFARENLYDNAGIKGGVHSDEHSEGSHALEIDMGNPNGPVGCGRWQRGAEIATEALVHIDKIIEEIHEEVPSVIDGLEEEARALAKANAELAKRVLATGERVLPSGRQVVQSAIKNGAEGIVLAGDHVEETAEYSLRKGETHDNRKTQRKFHADGWVNQHFFEENKDVLPYDPRLVLLQDVIMAKATKLVLAGNSKVDSVRV